MSSGRPAWTKARLKNLAIRDEFMSLVSKRQGIVVGFGYVRDVDERREGKLSRVRACRVRYGSDEVIHSAEMVVRVPFEHPHRVYTRVKEDSRWSRCLDEPSKPPSSFAIGDTARLG